VIKKIIIGGVFVIGGYYLIKKLLPEFHSKYLELNTISADDIFAEKERVRAENEKKMRDAFERKLGTRNPENYSQSELLKKMMFAPDFQYDENGKLILDGSKFNFGIEYDPKNLDSFKGLKDWQPIF
jgi:hypothetical protein